MSIERFAADLYQRALNLTLRNPLLRLPNPGRRGSVIELPPSSFADVGDLLGRGSGSISLCGIDASEFELSQVGAPWRGTGRLRLRVDCEHEVLKARLRKIQRSHEEMLEKRGFPCAYIAFGVLEWLAKDGALTQSPLLLVPVDLETGSDHSVNELRVLLSPSEREPLVNPALVAYLKREFGVELKQFPPDEDISGKLIRQWLNGPASDSCRTHPDWRVKLELRLGLFDCGAIAADCDPHGWSPALSRRALTKTVLQGTAPFSGPPEAIPFSCGGLVLEADGSQLNALMRVASGANIALHGPPGTGKSQTIVNLIAQALHMGKSVLFMTQKPGAADVVHRRLKECGLDAYCTNLVSVGDGKRVKSEMLNGLRARIAPQTVAKSAGGVRAALDASVRVLDDHVAALRMVVPALGVTARELVGELAVHTSRQVPVLPAVSVTLPGNTAALARAEQALESLAKAREAVSDSAFRSLAGLRAKRESGGAHHAAESLLAAGRRLMRVTAQVRQAELDLRSAGYTGTVVPAPAGMSTLVQHSESAVALASPGLGSRAAGLRTKASRAVLKRLGELQARRRMLVSSWPRFMELSDVLNRSNEGTARGELAVARTLPLAGMPVRRGEGVESALLDIAASFDELGSGLHDGALASLISSAATVQTWERRVALADWLASGAQHGALLVQGGFQGAGREPATLRRLVDAIRRLSSAKAELEPKCLLGSVPDGDELRITHSLISQRTSMLSRCLGTLIDARYRAAVTRAGATILPNVPRSEWSAVLARCLAWRAVRGELAEAEAEAGVVSPATAALGEWDAAAEWLVEARDRAHAAGVGKEALWSLVQQSGRESPAGAAARALAAAKRLVAVRPFVEAVSTRSGGDPVTSAGLAKILNELARGLRLVRSCAAALSAEGERKLADIADAAWEFIQLDADVRQLNADPAATHALWGNAPSLDLDLAPFDLAARWLDALESCDADWVAAANWSVASVDGANDRCTALASYWTQLTSLAEEVAAALAEYASCANWEGQSATLEVIEDCGWEEIDASCATLLAHEPDVARVMDLSERGESCAGLAGHGVIAALWRGDIKSSELISAYRRAVLERSLLRDKRLSGLSHADAISLDGARGRLAQLDRDLRRQNAAEIISSLRARTPPEGVSRGLRRELTEFGLISLLLGQTRPRFEVKDLFEKAAGAMRALQPCVIASPVTVSECLPRTAEAFDLVIIDEASQVPPEAALGAIARARQAVIVGDPRQLPPTNFFGSSAEEAEDEDFAGVTDVESILDRACAALENVHLSCHYRSRHHSLIEFSNRFMYERRLVIGPSTAPRDGKSGVLGHYVESGRYSASLNREEARYVAQRAIRQLQDHPEESLGVVAFNVQQADEIEVQIEQIARQSTKAFEALASARTGSDPVFVRSLESVQGDERDVIFISYTYGPDPASGVVAQRFGPITHDGGDRRLNVLVTRARSRVEVFHSMLPEQIVGTGRGPTLMREYLRYARQTPTADISIGEFESGFEEEVARAIEQAFPELVVQPQVGCVGFRIDLGISRKSDPCSFLLGVECDGATYHRSMSARDRDLVRQSILEHNNWRIHRIWSTAWWKNPSGELQRLKARIDDAIKESEVSVACLSEG